MAHAIHDANTLARHAESPFFRAEIEEMIRLAECRPRIWFVDIGCGNGSLVLAAHASGARGCGLDASRDSVRTAREFTHIGSFLQAFAQRLPVASESVDLVFAQHIIEHLADYPAALLEWLRVLKRGGRLVVLTPNARYPDPTIFEDPTHVVIFDPKTLREAIATAGFRTLRTETIFPHLRGHTVLGLRWRRLFTRVPPWRSSGRSLVCVAEKP